MFAEHRVAVVGDTWCTHGAYPIIRGPVSKPTLYHVSLHHTRMGMHSRAALHASHWDLTRSYQE